MKRGMHHWTLLPLLLLLLAAGTGCLFSTPTGDAQPTPVTYLPYHSTNWEDAADNLKENFLRAWEARDLAEYRDSILYDGEVLATDAQVYPAFMFYYDEAGEEPGQTFPLFDTYEREIQRATKMFGGLPGEDHLGNVVPGIRSISLRLLSQGPWSDELESQVENHDYPDGTLEGFFETDMTITLKSDYINNINAWIVDDVLRFHVIPVETGSPGVHRYRIWKWRDIITQ